MACGPQHAALTTKSGAAFTWGCGRNGRLGHGTNIDRSVWSYANIRPCYVVLSLAWSQGCSLELPEKSRVCLEDIFSLSDSRTLYWNITENKKTYT